MPRTEPVVAPADVFHTVEMVDALNAHAPEGERWECIYGELFHVTPARPWHAVVVQRLHRALLLFADQEPAAGFVGNVEAKVTFQRRDTYVSPDIWAVRLDEMRALDWDRITAPLLAVEVLSPSTQRKDRYTKRRLYQNEGVPLVWLVDADARHVEVWTPEADLPRVEREWIHWTPEGARASFWLPLDALFAPL